MTIKGRSHLLASMHAVLAKLERTSSGEANIPACALSPRKRPTANSMYAIKLRPYLSATKKATGMAPNDPTMNVKLRRKRQHNLMFADDRVERDHPTTPLAEVLLKIRILRGEAHRKINYNSAGTLRRRRRPRPLSDRSAGRRRQRGRGCFAPGASAPPTVAPDRSQSTAAGKAHFARVPAALGRGQTAV